MNKRNLYPNPSDGSTFKSTTANGFMERQMSCNDLNSGLHWIRAVMDGITYQTKLMLQK
ncbi:MAG: hypothetical protein ABIQ74_03655 [Chitinophagales bacterium]